MAEEAVSVATATCPACGAPVGTDATFCEACGHIERAGPEPAA